MNKYKKIENIFEVLPESSRFRKNLFDPRCFGGVLYKIEPTILSVNRRRLIRANRSEIIFKINMSFFLRLGLSVITDSRKSTGV
jgi:hypothetical protein